MVITFAMIVFGVLLDQVTKLLASAKLTSVATYPLIENVLHLTYVENRGAAFGMLAEHRWVFMIFSTVAIALMLVWLVREKPESLWLRISVAAIVAGGIGNMIDRVRLGYVVDFIDCRFIDFYVFNVADSFVCVGCGMLIVGVLYAEIAEQRRKKNEKTAEVSSDEDK